MLKKIILPLIFSSSLLFSTNIDIIENNGTEVNKQILKDNNLNIKIKKGYFNIEDNEVYYLLHITSSFSQILDIDNNKLNLTKDKATKLVISEKKLENFLDEIKFEQKLEISLEKKKEEFENQIRTIKEKHLETTNNIKKMAKSKLLEILEYTKKLENNVLMLKEQMKKVETDYVQKSIVNEKDRMIDSLKSKLMEVTTSRASKEQLDLLKTQVTNYKTKFENAQKTIINLQNNNSNELNRHKMELNNKLQLLEVEKDKMNSSIYLLEKLQENVKKLPNTYDKEILSYTIEDMKSIFK